MAACGAASSGARSRRSSSSAPIDREPPPVSAAATGAVVSDRFLDAPQGRAVPWPPLFHATLAAVARHTALRDRDAFGTAVDRLVGRYRGDRIDALAGIDDLTRPGRARG